MTLVAAAPNARIAAPGRHAQSREEIASSLGMFIALGAWTMMFAALFFVYLGARARFEVWPPPGVPHLPVALPALNTAILLASSGVLAFAVRELGRGRRRLLAPLLGLGMTLGVAFLGLQLVVWRDLWLAGLLPSSGLYGSVFYGLTGLHALHVLAGLVVLLVVFGRAYGGAYDAEDAYKVRLVAWFWHFVDVVWVLMFLSIYVL